MSSGQPNNPHHRAMPGTDEATSPSDDVPIDPGEAEGQPPPYPMPPLPSYTPGPYRQRSSTTRHRHRTFFRFKNKEGNMLGAVVNMVVLMLLCTAMAEPQWFYLRGGGCSQLDSQTGTAQTVNYLGVSNFMAAGKFQYTSKEHSTVHSTYSSSSVVLEDCVTNLMVNIMKIIIMLGFLAIISAIIAFLADLLGPTRHAIKIARRNAVFSITTLIFCVINCGLCYWFTEQLEAFQTLTRLHANSKATVDFSVGMYLVTAAAAVSVLATALNLMRRHGSSSSCWSRRRSSSSPPSSSHQVAPAGPQEVTDQQQLLSDYDGMEDVGMGRLQFYPPPPPYTNIPQEPV